MWDPTNTYIHLTYREGLLNNLRMPHGKPLVFYGQHMLKDEIFLDLCINQVLFLIYTTRSELIA